MIQRKCSPQKGQALVEYVMLMVVIIGVFVVTDRTIRKNIGKLWLAMGQEISAGCVGCTPPDNVR